MLIKKIEKQTIEDLEKKRKVFIEKGGNVASDSSKSEWMFINMRIRTDMVSKIDGIIKNERIGMTRTGWILEAIYEKFKRSEK